MAIEHVCHPLLSLRRHQLMESIEKILQEYVVDSRVAYWRNVLPAFLFPARVRTDRLSSDLYETIRAMVRRGRELHELGELPPDCILSSLLELKVPATGKVLPADEVVAEFHMYLVGVRSPGTRGTG